MKLARTPEYLPRRTDREITISSYYIDDGAFARLVQPDGICERRGSARLVREQVGDLARSFYGRQVVKSTR